MEKIYHHFPPESDFILFHHKAQGCWGVCGEAGRAQPEPARVFKCFRQQRQLDVNMSELLTETSHRPSGSKFQIKIADGKNANNTQ